LIENGFIVERDSAKNDSTQAREAHKDNIEKSVDIFS